MMATARVSMGELVEEYLREAKSIEASRRAKKKIRDVEAAPFWPHEAVRDTAIVLFFVASLLYISAGMPYFLEAPANPAGQPEVILPDWYLLWSYGLLKPGVANPIGEGVPYEVPVLSEVHQVVYGPQSAVVLDAKTIGVVLNGLIITPLLVLPFIDRGKNRRPQEAPLQASLGMGALIFVFTVSVFSVNNVVYNDYPIYGATLYDLSPRFANAIELADAPGLDGMDELTVMAVFKLEDVGTNKWIVSKASSMQPEGVSYYIRLLSSNALEYGISVETEEGPRLVQLAGGNVRDTTSYHHAAFVYDGTEIRGYLDGIFLDSLAASGPILNTDAPVLLGTGPAVNGLATNFAGRIDEVRIFDSAIGEAGVQAAGQSVVAIGGEIVHWHLDETTGTTVRDASGNGHEATFGKQGAAFSQPDSGRGAFGNDAHFTGVRSTFWGLPAIFFWVFPVPIAFLVLRRFVLEKPWKETLLVFGVTAILLLVIVAYGIGNWTPFIPFHVFEGCGQPFYLFFLCIGTSPLVSANPAFDPVDGLLSAMQVFDNTLLAYLTWWIPILGFEITYFGLAYWHKWSAKHETYEFFLNRTYYRVR